MNSINDIVAKINFLQQNKKTILVGIDGFGGSGKSTLAKLIKEKFPSAIIVEMDDFYSPELKKADFERVNSQVLKPLRNNQTAVFKIYDWQKNQLKDTTPISPDNIIIVEGVYSLEQNLIVNYDVKIWVDCPPEVGLKRGIERDRSDYGVDTKDKWINDWQPREKDYVKSQSPQNKADFIIDGR